LLQKYEKEFAFIVIFMNNCCDRSFLWLYHVFCVCCIAEKTRKISPLFSVAFTSVQNNSSFLYQLIKQAFKMVFLTEKRAKA
jgi:hypothetical protein